MNHSGIQAVVRKVVGLPRVLLTSNPFRNADKELRNGWWIAIYFLLMAMMIFPLTFYVRQHEGEVEIWQQACMSIIAAIALQRLRGKPLSEMWGAFDITWGKYLVWGSLLGCLLMVLPALVLVLSGQVTLHFNSLSLSLLLTGLGSCAAVAIAEEVVFRGVFLQRLRAGMGTIAAQIIVAAYFWLTHSGNPGMEGHIKILASINIFLASILFGLTYLKTNGLAMPIGLHLMANFTQGTIFGFGVSGHSEYGVLSPQFESKQDWLTGGQFGLEASLPGLLFVIIFIFFVAKIPNKRIHAE